MSQSNTHEKVRNTVKAAIAPNADKVRTLWLDAATALSKADARMTVATTERKGGYTCAVQSALAAGSKETFEAVTSQVFSEIRANANGLAKRLGCKLGKGRKGSPAAYLIPGSLMVAKSTLVAAFDKAVPLAEKNDDGELEPRTFTAIRNDVRECGEAERVAQLSGREKSVYMVRVMAQRVAEAADAFTVSELPDVLERLTALCKIASGAQSRAEAEEASKGAELAADDGDTTEAAAA